MRKLQIFLLESKVWWRIDSDTMRLNDNMELISRNLNESLNHHQDAFHLLEANQEKLTLKVMEIEPKTESINQHLSTIQQSIDTLEKKLTVCNDHFNRQSKLLLLFMRKLIFIFIKVSSMGERFHIHSSEMEDKKIEMTNIFKEMGEALTLKIDKYDEKLATVEDLILMNQEEMTNNLKNINVKLNKSRSFQDNIYEEIMEHTRSMYEKNITSSNNYTEEKFKELMDYLEIEKVDQFEVFKLLGLTHSL